MKATKILLLLLCLFCLTAPASAAGSGTAADPYQITTAAELQSMHNDLGAHYKLMNNIDLNGVAWTPIGTLSAGFHGTFDGNGKTISNLVLSSTTQYTGFFGGLTSGATVKDVTFSSCTVTSTSQRTGVVFGTIIMSPTAHDVATIDNVDCVGCKVTGTGIIVGAIGALVFTDAVVDMIDCDVSYATIECTSGNIAGAIGGVFGPADLDIIGGSVKNSRFKANGESVGAIGYVHNTASVSLTDTVIENCIFEALYYNVGTIGAVYGASSVSMTGIEVKNCVMKCGMNYAGGLIGVVDNADSIGTNAQATNCDVTDTTIYATSNYAGGVCGRIMMMGTGVFDGCTVSDCTILATSYAAGICPAYS